MRYVAAYLLAVQGGNESPSAADLTAILSSVGIEADSKQMSIVIDNLKGKSVEELITEGMGKLASMPSGGGGGGGGAAAAGGAAPAEAAKEEKKVESESESDDDMGFDLFG